MKKSILSAAVVAALPFYALGESQPIDLGSIEVVDTAQKTESKVGQKGAAAPIQSYDPIDTGKTVISQDAIKQNVTGDNDTTRIIQDLPNVQIDTDQEEVSLERIQSIRPSDFSISGGTTYQNNIMIDGIGVNSVHDTYRNTYTDDDAVEYVSGVTAQTLYVDPSILQSAEVMDSNVSAKYGEFLGGAVNYKVRDPKKEFHMSLDGGYQSDSLVHYKPDYSDLEEDEEIGSKPNFTKYNGAISFDLPITDSFQMLMSYSRSQSNVEYTRDEEYGGDTYPNKDYLETYLLKGIYEYSDDLTLKGQVIYSPYEHEFEPAKRYKGFSETSSTGLQSYVSVEGASGLTTWNSKISVTKNDSSRDSETNYKVRFKGDSVDWCSSTNCYEGTVGDLDFLQTDYVWDADVDTPLFGGSLRFGAVLGYTTAERNRPSDYYSYSTAKSGSWDCEDGDVSCNSESISYMYTLYPEHSANVSMAKHALWIEYEKQIASVNVRAGLRGSHNSFLDNYDVAPRFTINWEFLSDTYLTLGANRYYANSLLSYALLSKSADSYIYKRNVNSSTGDIGDWYLFKTSSAYLFDTDKLDTPYSDELAAAVTVPTFLDGHLRLKAVYRQNRKNFSVSSKLSDSVYYREMGNDGKSDYQGYTIEWTGGFEHHKFNANITWSETHYFGQQDYSTYEDTSEQMYYNGSLYTLEEINKMSDLDNYAAPIKASVSWNADWFNERLLTSLKVNYRGSYEYLGDTGENITIDDETYDVYGQEKKLSYMTADLNLIYKLINTDTQQLSLKAKINNIFDASPHATTSEGLRYQTGRNFWLGFSYYM